MNLKCLVSITAMLFLIGCSSEKQSNLSEESNMNPLADGAFLLSKVTITEDGETTELLRDQMKIYSKGRFMFAFDNESTGEMDVGAGNASWVNGVMVEEPLVNHDGPVSGLSFDISIEPTETGFNQVLHGMKYDDGRVLETMVEEWNRAPGVVTPYDGLWRLEGRETDDPDLTDFSEIKMIGGGHFAWYHTWSDTVDHADFGYGEFIDHGEGSVTEVARVGSIEGFEGEWNINFTLIGSDMLQQTFINKTDSTEVIQNYKRL